MYNYLFENHLAISGIIVSLFALFYAFMANKHSKVTMDKILDDTTTIKKALEPLALEIAKSNAKDTELKQENKEIIKEYDEKYAPIICKNVRQRITLL